VKEIVFSCLIVEGNPCHGERRFAGRIETSSLSD